MSLANRAELGEAVKRKGGIPVPKKENIAADEIVIIIDNVEPLDGLLTLEIAGAFIAEITSNPDFPAGARVLLKEVRTGSSVFTLVCMGLAAAGALGLFVEAMAQNLKGGSSPAGLPIILAFERCGGSEIQIITQSVGSITILRSEIRPAGMDTPITTHMRKPGPHRAPTPHVAAERTIEVVAKFINPRQVESGGGNFVVEFDEEGMHPGVSDQEFRLTGRFRTGRPFRVLAIAPVGGTAGSKR